MNKWLLIFAVCIPMMAHADPKRDHPTADGPVQTSYAVSPPASHGYIPDGWAMRATFRGRAMDLQSRDWTEDPHAQPRDIEAGYGWRDGRATAVIGDRNTTTAPSRRPTSMRSSATPTSRPR